MGMSNAALLSALLLAAPIAEAAGVFLPATGVDTQRTVAASGRRTHNAVPRPPVRVAHAELERARDEAALSGSGRLTLNLGHVHLQGVIERTAQALRGYSLSGRIDDPGGGFVTLAVHGEAVAGTIWTPDASYEIVPRGGGLHIVRPAAAIECGGTVTDGRVLYPMRAPVVQNTGEVDDGSNTVVDVLVVWTPEREEQAGGEDEVRAEIGSWIAYANDAFERSGAFVALNLVGAELVDYVQADFHTDILRLASRSDGHMDEVHEKRDAYRADLVTLTRTGRYGLATGTGFSIAGPSAWIFTHEVGHNFIVWHDHYDDPLQLGGYNVAQVVPGPRCILTIMASGRQCDDSIFFTSANGRVPYFSSPQRYHFTGSALGVWRFGDARTTSAPADAVAAINRNRLTVAALR